MAQRKGENNYRKTRESGAHERRIRRLPKNFGCIRYLGPGRRNPYAVHESSGLNGEHDTGGKSGKKGKRPGAICYVPDWETGYKVLILVHAGVYKKGMERTGFEIHRGGSGDTDDRFILYAKKAMREIEILRSGGNVPGLLNDDPDNGIDVTGSAKSSKGEEASESAGAEKGEEKEADVKAVSGPASAAVLSSKCTEPGACKKAIDPCKPEEKDQEHRRTFADVFNSFFEHKFGVHAQRRLSRQTRNATNAAWKKLSPLKEQTLDEVDIDRLEELVNGLADAGYSKSTVDRVVTLIHQLYKYARTRGYCRSSCGLYLERPAAKEEVHHQAFSDPELAKIWDAYRTSANRSVRDVCRMILINCYSGFRIREFETMETHMPGGTLASMKMTGDFPSLHIPGSAVLSQTSGGSPVSRLPGNLPVAYNDNPGEAPAAQLSWTSSFPASVPYESGGFIKTEENKGGGVAFFRGGFKTGAGRNRIVPIHSAILPLVREITVSGTDKTDAAGATNAEGATETTATTAITGATDAEGATDETNETVAANADEVSCSDCLTGKVRFLCGKGHSQYRRDMKEVLLQIGVDGVMKDGVLRHHTPHSCRHTFSRLCESYGVNEADRKRLLGHSFGNDITNGVYGHRSVEELQAEIEKIRVSF